ncbi:MAG TPA: nitrate/nitrite transporter [Chloroflexota bacterium]|nr:nitrate/nitrite transporter [Chloroflexota bacterium]
MERSRSWNNLGLATAAFALSFAVWSLLAPLASGIQKQYGLSDTQTGLLLAVPVLLGSLARIPMGIITDRLGGRITFTALMLFCIIPVVFVGLADSFGALLFWGFWLGIAGSSFAVGVPFVSRWFPPGNQGTALGIYGMGNIGTALAAYLVPWIAGQYGWSYAFWVFAPALAVAALLFWLLAEDAPITVRPVSLAESLEVVRQHRISWLFGLFYFVTFGGFVAFSVFLPKLLVDWFGFAKTDAGFRTAGFVVLATVIRPMGGYLADRVGGARVLSWVFTAAPVLGLVLAFEALGPNIVAVTGACLALAAAFGLGNGAVFKLVAQYFPRNTGIVTGVVGAAGGIGGFFPPLVMGAVKDLTGNYALGLVLLALFTAFCLLMDYLVLLRRPISAENEHAEGRQRVKGRKSAA